MGKLSQKVERIEKENDKLKFENERLKCMLKRIVDKHGGSYDQSAWDEEFKDLIIKSTVIFSDEIKFILPNGAIKLP